MLLAKIKQYYRSINNAFILQFGFEIRETSFDRVVDYLHTSKDPSSLAVTRILFGLAMLFDIPDERGGSTMDSRWGNPNSCHFPLIPFIRAMPLPYMAVVYFAMWLGALGIMLGYKFRTSATVFATSYWYLFLIEKSFWNNHSYLFGLVSLILIGTQADNYLSLDSYLHPKAEKSVPYWNYFLLKFQFFILYFVAGLKKGSAEWLSGYSLINLSEHWVFDPFKILLSVSQTDYLIVHWFAFVFDLTVAFWMMWSRTRHLAMIFCAAFHLMNIRLFRIGMFPWVCLATMPLFYPFDWPKLLYKRFTKLFENTENLSRTLIEFQEKETSSSDANSHNEQNQPNQENYSNLQKTDKRDTLHENKAISQDELKQKRITVFWIFIYVIFQALLPYSHFITKGYNNWTNGLYGYSWDMMVHTWDTKLVVLKILDHDLKKEFYLDPFAWTPNDRWSRHADMVYQYAHCLKQNMAEKRNSIDNLSKDLDKKNISIYIDVLLSMNGRFLQRLFDPTVDLLKAEWSPFKYTGWLMPLLVDAEDWRATLDHKRDEIYSWNNFTDVLFVADFPGYKLENYISEELTNVTLSVLEGTVAYEPEMLPNYTGKTTILNTEDNITVIPDSYHNVHTLRKRPAYYMYTFTNKTIHENIQPEKAKEKLPIHKEFSIRFKNILKFFQLVYENMFQLFFRMPLSVIIRK